MAGTSSINVHRISTVSFSSCHFMGLRLFHAFSTPVLACILSSPFLSASISLFSDTLHHTVFLQDSSSKFSGFPALIFVKLPPCFHYLSINAFYCFHGGRGRAPVIWLRGTRTLTPLRFHCVPYKQIRTPLRVSTGTFRIGLVSTC